MEIGLIILFGLYLFKLFQNRIKEKREYEEATKYLYEIVEEILGTEDLQRLKKNKIWVGMLKCLIYYSWGKPHNIKKSVNQENVNETWYFGAKPYKYAGETRYKYKNEISINNSFLTGFKNI